MRGNIVVNRPRATVLIAAVVSLGLVGLVGCNSVNVSSAAPGVSAVKTATPAATEMTGPTAALTASPPPTASPSPKTSKVVITPGPKMASGRWLFTATKLADGRILLSGGYTLADEERACKHVVMACSVPETATAEIYDPRTKSFTPTGSMARPMLGHQAVLLRDGRVLILGGPNDDPGTAEVYDPATGHFSDLGDMNQDTSGDAGPIFTPAPSDAAQTRALESQLGDQTVTVLADGRVLIAGGQDQIGDSSNAVTVFDPTTDTFRNLPGMPIPWKDASASLLPDGRVLFTGGLDTSTYNITTNTYQLSSAALLFDPAMNAFTITGTTHIPRDGGNHVVLQGGRVLIVGGLLDPINPGCGSPIQAEVYDPASGRFSLAGGIQPPWLAVPVLIPDGRVLLIGGSADACVNGTAAESVYARGVEAYDPDSGTVSLLASGVLPNGSLDCAVALDDGSILVFIDQGGDYILTLK